MKIGNIEVNNPLVLGPMAGVTDWAFRTVCAQMGANITVTEMVSSRALVYKDQKSARLLRKNEGSICGAQIFGIGQPILISRKSQPEISSAIFAASAMMAGSLPKICAPQMLPPFFRSSLALF